MTIPLPDQGKGYCTSDMAQTILTAAADKTCLALGPGLGTQPATNELVWIIIKEVKIPTVVDADGLNLIATDIKRIKQSKAPLILTPHPGEMARLTGKPVAEIQKDRIGSARQLSMDLGVYIVLKGARTIVASPDGMTWINPSGNPGMAGPGMGDILTGLIAGFLSQGLPAAEAAKCGVYLHGLAADLLAEQVPWGYIASEVAEAVPHAIQRVLNNPPRLPIHFPIL
jgi:NAD(P)H-hydrate epimerase